MALLPSPDEKRAALQEVIQAPTFVRAGQLQGFLRLICEMEIAGRAGEINEYRIGVEVLGRPEGYSPSQDSVVRRRAVDLREKLEEVYLAELAGSPLRIELPKGRYVPRFVRVEPPAAVPAAAAGPPPVSPRRPWLPMAGAFLAGVALTSAVFLLQGRPRADESGTTYEAEAAGNTLGGTATAELCVTCSGSHRVRRIGNLPANHVVIQGVRAVAGGPHVVVLHYVLKGERTFFVSVNDGPGQAVPLTGDDWGRTSSAPVTVTLQPGINHVKLYNDDAYAPDLDRIVVRPTEPR